MSKKRILTGLLSVFIFLVTAIGSTSFAQSSSNRFRVLALAETGEQHAPFVAAAKEWLNKLAADSNFVIDYIESPVMVNKEYLSRYQLFIQLNYPPYGWSDTAKKAFEEYINQGRGGWIGLHHATLLGDFNGHNIWTWFSNFMGGIRFTNYIAGFAAATVRVEDTTHPCMQGIPASFPVAKDEWYTYDKSPRPNVQVLATVNETSYYPPSDIKMGDHPVVWSNTAIKARNIYIQMGHDPSLFENTAFTSLLRNAVRWASRKL